MDTILRLGHITKSFPGVKALSDIHLEIARGEIHALLGENGAGKSTLMKILCGIHRPDTGTIEIDGAARHFASYHDAVAAGIGIVFQEFSLIPHLDAVDNLFLGRELRTRWGVRDRSRMRRTAAGIFARLGVSIDLDAPLRTLSVAQQQFVEIGKALSLDARILILDEPTATLTPAEAERLFAIMRELKRQGVAMIFISHPLDEIFAVCDRITVLRDGQYVATTDVARTDVEQLVRMMVGRRIESSFPPKPARAADAPAVLEVDALQIERDEPHFPGQLKHRAAFETRTHEARHVPVGFRRELERRAAGAEPCARHVGRLLPVDLLEYARDSRAHRVARADRRRNVAQVVEGIGAGLVRLPIEEVVDVHEA